MAVMTVWGFRGLFLKITNAMDILQCSFHVKYRIIGTNKVMDISQFSIHVKYLIMKNTQIAQGGLLSLSLSLSHFSLSLLSFTCTQVLETELIDQETVLRIQKIMQSAQAAGTCDIVCARMWVGRGGGGYAYVLISVPTPHRHLHPPTLVVAGTEITGKQSLTAHPLALAH